MLTDVVLVALLPFITRLVAVEDGRQRSLHDHRCELEQVGLVLAEGTARHKLLLQQLDGL